MQTSGDETGPATACEVNSPTLPASTLEPNALPVPTPLSAMLEDDGGAQPPNDNVFEHADPSPMTSTSRSFTIDNPRDKKNPLLYLPMTSNWLEARDGFSPILEVVLRTRTTARLCHEIEVSMVVGTNAEAIGWKAAEAQLHMKRVMQVAQECRLGLKSPE